MGCICDFICRICGTDIYSCENWDFRGEFQFGNGNSHLCGSGDGVGHRVSHRCPEGHRCHKPKELAVFDSFGTCHWCSWLCSFRAIQLGEISKVVPIDKLSVVITLVLAFVFLHEQFTLKSALGAILITAGTLVMVV